MGYRIEYDKGTSQYEVMKNTPLRFPTLLILCFLLFLAATSIFWPEGMSVLQEVLIPGDNDITLGAFDVMANELRSGAEFEDAVMAFCYEVINSAKTAR